MRTTLQIDDDVLQAARSLAQARHQSLGKVISDLARKGLRPQTPYIYKDDFPVFEVREDAVPFGIEQVKEALEEP